MAPGAETNLAVISSQRTYSFVLKARPDKPSAQGGVYRVIFTYPEEETARTIADYQAIAQRRPAQILLPDAAPKTWNTRYPYKGDRSVRPRTILDDGRFTMFGFGDLDDIPAIFAVEEDGEETLVNWKIAGPYVMVERLAPAWRLRAGKKSGVATNAIFGAKKAGAGLIATPVQATAPPESPPLDAATPAQKPISRILTDAEARAMTTLPKPAPVTPAKQTAKGRK